MAIHLITLPTSNPSFFFTTVLDGVHYGFDFNWNDRDQAWYFDVSDGAGNLIQAGIKLVLGAYLGRAMRVPPFSTGVFVAVDTSGEQKDAGIDDLGARIQLYYIPDQDLATLIGSLSL